MTNIVKEFFGHSGCRVTLRENQELGLFVEKTGDIQRNVERLLALENNGLPVPKVYTSSPEKLTMQYLHGLDMKNYLVHNSVYPLVNFLLEILNKFKNTSTETKNYEQVYDEKLSWLPADFPIRKNELIDSLPKTLPCSLYHGDLTLENLLHTNNGFYLIDPVTIEYDSYCFDIAKLRQDIDCLWFLRNTDLRVDAKLHVLRDQLKLAFPEAFNDSMLILMLLRVLKHCQYNDSNYQFIMKEIYKLWK